MKKTFKKIFAGLAAIAIAVTSLSVAALAYYQTNDSTYRIIYQWDNTFSRVINNGDLDRLLVSSVAVYDNKTGVQVDYVLASGVKGYGEQVEAKLTKVYSTSNYNFTLYGSAHGSGQTQSPVVSSQTHYLP